MIKVVVGSSVHCAVFGEWWGRVLAGSRRSNPANSTRPALQPLTNEPDILFNILSSSSYHCQNSILLIDNQSGNELNWSGVKSTPSFNPTVEPSNIAFQLLQNRWILGRLVGCCSGLLTMSLVPSALRPCCPHPDQDKVLQRIEIRNKKKLSEFNRGIYIFMDIVRSYGGWGWGLDWGAQLILKNYRLEKP